MGSQSDFEVMKAAHTFLTGMGIPVEHTIVSAHRTPQRLCMYAETARSRGLSVIIAGAGGAAHLPGMVAAMTTLPVIGVPIRSTHSIDGWDSLLSIVQMPTGVPVATMAINGATNAAILATQIMALQSPELAAKLEAYKHTLSEGVMASIQTIGLEDPLKGHAKG